MTDAISKLEKLADLKAKGVLTEDEFAAEKAALLGTKDGAAATAPAQSTPAFSAKWQQRFDFFREFGSPWSSEGRAHLRAMRYLDRVRIEVNFFALIFGVFYLLFLGLWRRALSLVGFIVVALIAFDQFGLSDRYDNLLMLFIAGVCASTANYAYYRKTTTGRDSWNPFDFWNPAHADLGVSPA